MTTVNCQGDREMESFVISSPAFLYQDKTINIKTEEKWIPNIEIN